MNLGEISLPRSNQPRSETISSSEVPAILRLSPWQTPRGVWLRKRGDDQQVETAAMRRGTAAEDVIDQWYCYHGHDGNPPICHVPGLRYGDQPVQGPEPWMVCSPDAMCHDGSAWYIVEYKTSAQPWSKLPDYYEAQVRWQLACIAIADYAVVFALTGLPEVVDQMLGSEDINIRQRGQNVLHILLECGQVKPQVFILKRDARQEWEIVERVKAWRDLHIVVGVEPEIEAGDLPAVEGAWRALETTNESEVQVAPSDGEIVSLAANLVVAEANAKSADDAAKQARAQFLAAWAGKYGSTHTLRLPDGSKITYKQQAGRSSIDTERLRQDYPAIAAEYTKQGAPFRTLRIGSK